MRPKHILRAALLGLVIAAAPGPAPAQTAAPAAGSSGQTGCTFSAWLSLDDFRPFFRLNIQTHNFPAMLEGRSADGVRSYRACFRFSDVYFHSNYGASPERF